MEEKIGRIWLNEFRILIPVAFKDRPNRLELACHGTQAQYCGKFIVKETRECIEVVELLGIRFQIGRLHEDSISLYFHMVRIKTQKVMEPIQDYQYFIEDSIEGITHIFYYKDGEEEQMEAKQLEIAKRIAPIKKM